MVKKLTAHGDSSALILDREMLELLNIDNNTPLEVTTDGRRLIIEPVNGDDRGTKFRAAADKSHEQYAKTFKRLAE
jgi:antitoxin component of MazEF toxin-antitoxin module